MSFENLVLLAYNLIDSSSTGYAMANIRRRIGGDFRQQNLTLHDTRVAPGDENTAVMKGFPLPGPIPWGEGEKERLRRVFSW